MQVLKGTSPHIKNETELEQLVEKLKAHANKEECLMMWTCKDIGGTIVVF